ncbi:MAG: hypothetical protein PVH62_04790 [Anaerolineae bacterium]|jgi:hypothetical protein
MSERVVPLNRDRLSVLIAVILLLSVLFRFFQFPEIPWRVEVLGSPLEIWFTGTFLLVVLTVALVVTGTRFVIYAHPAVPHHLPRPSYLSWVLPGLLAGLASYMVHLTPTLRLWSVGVVLMGFLISLAVAAEFITLSTEDPRYTRARLALNLLAYLLAFVLFYIVYRLRARSLITATMMTLSSFLVALDLLSVADVGVGRVAIYAGVVGLTVGEFTWALNYWRMSNWIAAFCILLVFYVASGIAHQHLLKRLTTRVLAEFALVTVFALSVLFLAS